MTQSVVILGKGRLAIRICEWFILNNKYKIASVVPVTPEPEWCDSLTAWCDLNNLPLTKDGDYKNIPDGDIDLAVSVFYDKIIDKNFIDRCKKIINVHNSPLPKYRGVRPINWALRDNQREHGVTIHEIREGIDTGPIISQIKYSIYPEIEEVCEVYEKALDYAYLLFEKTMPIIDKVIPRRQVGWMASYHGKKDIHKLGDRQGIRR